MNYKNILRSFALFIGLILLINIDQSLFKAVSSKASQTYDFRLTYIVVFLRSFVFILLGFIFYLKAKSINIKDLRKMKLVWSKVWINLLPILLLLFLYGPVGYVINIPLVRWFLSLQAPIMNISFQLHLLSVLTGYIFASCFKFKKDY